MKYSFTDQISEELYDGKLVKAYAEDAGYDLRFCGIERYVANRTVAVCHLGVRVELDPGTFGLLVPRSSLFIRHGLTLANGVGIIDAGYRDELKALLLFHQTGTFKPLQLGDRIVQLVILPLSEMHEVGAIRGARGFGSSGI